ncbi:unnamed protein product [Haemonchus placei]|uniref:Uncharacterized protein n=1 Tax=Haemonchus placei TaxID=6290 RepID=A0A0N4VYM3_HAEPC|nr:unnamed protein product [Haemonchus placei]
MLKHPPLIRVERKNSEKGERPLDFDSGRRRVSNDRLSKMSTFGKMLENVKKLFLIIFLVIRCDIHSFLSNFICHIGFFGLTCARLWHRVKSGVKKACRCQSLVVFRRKRALVNTRCYHTYCF